ncbi:MAG: hypothetical protein IJ275_07065 [Ruminococcus sp.]|nr:hypothetical protein [Ruminococcus sp.]
MAKKVTITLLILLLAGIAVIGVYFFTQGGFNSSDKQKATSAIISEQYLDEDMGDEEYIIDAKEEETQETEEATGYIPSDSDLADNTAEIATTNFSIGRIVDHTSGEEVQGRVVFGKGFNQSENYIKFNENGYFEIYLTGYLDEAKKGKYTEYDDIIYVEFEDGKAAEYDVEYTDSGLISYIMVNYGDYDIYFS